MSYQEDQFRRNKQANIRDGKVLEEEEDDGMIANEFSSDGGIGNKIF